MTTEYTNYATRLGQEDEDIFAEENIITNVSLENLAKYSSDASEIYYELKAYQQRGEKD